ncbi:MAG: hypothetical protein FWG39_01465 [Alphaproteobacteria bacterium]|nr:hypothetical protein [Alphaproteobacteria bacterium]
MKKSIIYALCSMLFLAACGGNDTRYNQTDFEMGGPDAPLLNERTAGFMDADNPEFGADAFRPKTQQEVNEMNARWDASRVETRWEEYKGTIVRVQIMLGSTDMREMRLKVIQNANGMDVDGDAAHVLARVADFEIKRVCGRNSVNYVMIFDRPSFEVLRPTPYFDFATRDEGSTMREYGFKCIY